MIDLDDCLTKLADGVTFDAEAAARLERRLAAEPSPQVAARRRWWKASAAMVGTATVAGAVIGAVLEVQRAPAAPEALLPASASGTTAALLFGEG